MFFTKRVKLFGSLVTLAVGFGTVGYFINKYVLNINTPIE